MKLAWKYSGLFFALGGVLLGTACSGIDASHSVSPATFLLPGLLQVEPDEPVLPIQPDRTPVQVAANRPR